MFDGALHRLIHKSGVTMANRAGEQLTHIAKKTYIFWFFTQGGGGGPDPLSPFWIRPCIAIDALSVNISSQPPQTQNMTSADNFVQPLSNLSIIFIGGVFSLESHLTGEPCDNYRCSELRFGMHIYLIKQVGKLLKIWWSEKEQGTQKTKILNWGTGENRDSWFHRNKRKGAHWKGLNISRMPKFFEPKLWP